MNSAQQAGFDEGTFEQLVAPHRAELKAHCYRMSGSVHDAEDLLQDSLLRAWRGRDSFQGRSSVRTWLFTIATNTCINALEARKVRGLPVALGPPGEPGDAMVPDTTREWLEPAPFLESAELSPEARLQGRQSVALAFLAALQLLPPRQRALVILTDVLGWEAAASAELLEMTVAAVNSALQRARATLAERGEPWLHQRPPSKRDVRPLIEKYLRAWESSDVSALVSLLHHDATLSMPPIPVWLAGTKAIEASLHEMVFAAAQPGDFALVETELNGCPAFAVYSRGQPFALHLLELRDERIAALTAFLDTRLFAACGLPTTGPR